MFIVPRNQPLIRAAGALLCLALVLAARTTEATPLSDLLVPGAMLHVGGLTFSDFTYLGLGEMPAATSINVVPEAGGGGLLFQGAFLDIPVGNGSDATFGYHVTADPGWSIIGAGLSGNPAIIGQGTLTLTETFAQIPAFLEILNNTGGPAKLTDHISGLSNFPSLTVTGVMQAGANSGAATLSFFTPTFQIVTVPEPASAALGAIAVGAMGAVGIGRRKRLFARDLSRLSPGSPPDSTSGGVSREMTICEF